MDSTNGAAQGATPEPVDSSREALVTALREMADEMQTFLGEDGGENALFDFSVQYGDPEHLREAADLLAAGARSEADGWVSYFETRIRICDEVGNPSRPHPLSMNLENAKELLAYLRSTGPVSESDVDWMDRRQIAGLLKIAAADADNRLVVLSILNPLIRRLELPAPVVQPDALLEAATAVADDVCSLLCPSTWKTADGSPPHHLKCKALRAALDRGDAHPKLPAATPRNQETSNGE